MPSRNKTQISNIENHPHTGQLLKKIMVSKNISMAEVARRIGVKQQSILNYINQPSIQTHNLFALSIAVNYNFLADIMDKLPQETLDTNLSSFQKTIQDKELEIQDLKKQIAIYKEILLNK